MANRLDVSERQNFYADEELLSIIAQANRSVGILRRVRAYNNVETKIHLQKKIYNRQLKQ